MTSNDNTDPGSIQRTADGPSWFRHMGSGWSTFLLIALVSTASQLIALEMAGLQVAAGARAWSTGGLAAVLGSLLMWKLAKTWPQYKKWIWLPLLLVALLSFIVVGSTNNYPVEVVVQEARPATQSLQATGNYNVSRTDSRICEPDQDYLACINAHVAAYNSVCVSNPLTWTASGICSQMSDFIAQIKNNYQGCGYGCRTQGEYGTWGWPYLRLEPEVAMASDNNALPQVTRTEHCSFDLGIIQIGTCGRDK